MLPHLLGVQFMLKMVLMAGAAVTLASAASAQAPSAQADVSLGKISNQYICRFNASVGRSEVGAEAAKAAGAMGQILHTYHNTIRGFAVRMPAEPGRNHISDLRANNPKISGCEQDQIARALIQGKPGGGGGATGETIPWGITRVGGAGTSNGKTGWVIDSGIDLDHPDLNVDVGRSRSFIKDSSPNDQNGHGTHVAGTMAAIDNEIGVIGVAPGALLVSVRVLDRRGSGSYSGVINGVDYVAGAAAAGDVANMSLGGPPSDLLDAAVVAAAAKGIHFTLAAGNSEEDANLHSPARAEGANVYTVSSFEMGDNATDEIDPWSYFSNFGNPPVDYAEPGSSVYSTYKDGGYATLSGTSMAAPHLGGILLAGAVRSDSTVDNDPDGNPDKIGER